MSERKSSLDHRRYVSEEKKEFAHQLRQNPTPSQARLWQEIRSKKIGWRFRRRAILYGWIVDFWCPAAKFAIEIDHASDVEREKEHSHRDSVLSDYGIRMLRIKAVRVFKDTQAVLKELKDALEKGG